MIALTKFDGAQIYVNPDLIQYLEASPDTRVTLTTGTMLMVLDDPSVVVERVIAYRRSILEGSAPPPPLRVIQGRQGS